MRSSAELEALKVVYGPERHLAATASKTRYWLKLKPPGTRSTGVRIREIPTATSDTPGFDWTSGLVQNAPHSVDTR